MSRNFELLQQAGKAHEVFPGLRSAAMPTYGRRAGLYLKAMMAESEGIKLAQRLFLLPGSEAPRLVVFCGVETGDGSSWICVRASESLASQVKASVCVVDANWRAPLLHEYFRRDNSKGLADAILESGPIRNYAHRLNGGNLWVITCGSRTTDPPALLNSDRLPPRLAELKAEFDYVLIDAPPVNLYAEAALLGKLADGVVLVVQANSTHRQVARKAKESLDSAKVRLLGSVLNKRTFPVPESLYRKL
jgi:capsular exopolysaccharide synthesis family protein